MNEQPVSARTLRKWLERLVALVRGIAARGVVRLVYPSRRLQALQVELLKGELRELEHVESYGLTAHPFRGAEAVVLFPLAARDQGVVIATPDRRYRLTVLAEGEVALYDDLGQVVHLKRDGVRVVSPTKVEAAAPSIEINATSVQMNAATVQISGALNVTGLITGTGGVADALGLLSVLRAAYNLHTHPESVGTVTGPPVPTV